MLPRGLRHTVSIPILRRSVKSEVEVLTGQAIIHSGVYNLFSQVFYVEKIMIKKYYIAKILWTGSRYIWWMRWLGLFGATCRGEKLPVEVTHSHWCFILQHMGKYIVFKDWVFTAGGLLWRQSRGRPGMDRFGKTSEEEVLGEWWLVLQVRHSQDSSWRLCGIPLFPLAGGRHGGGAARRPR